jgi:uncharacterized protein YfbU (UPF0304 family)
MGNITIKDKKLLLRTVRTLDLDLVKKLVEEVGVDPNEIIDGNKNAYLEALYEQKSYLRKLKKGVGGGADQKKHLEIVKYLTPKMTTTIGPTDGTTFIFSVFHQYFGNGIFDELIMTMIQSGYDIKNDKGIYKSLGIFELSTVKEIIKIVGIDDGASVFYAAFTSNYEVLEYLLDLQIPVNKGCSVTLSGDCIDYPLNRLLKNNPPEFNAIKKIIECGADIKLKDYDDKNCLELATENEAPKEIIDLLISK